MKPVLTGAGTNLVATTTRVLDAVLAADPDQEHQSICLMWGRDKDPHHGILSFLVGDDIAWAAGCWLYASRKLEYLVTHPDAVTSFEGANPDDGLYGGGLRLKGSLVIVSGLSAEADLVVGLLVLLCMGEVRRDPARQVAQDVSDTCAALFDLAVVGVSDLVPVRSWSNCGNCGSRNISCHSMGRGRDRITCHDCGHNDDWVD